MHINRGLLGWGVFLITLGLEAIAIRGGLLDAGLARRALEVWPLILIAIGFDLVLQRTPASSLGTIAVSLVFALMAGGLIATTPIASRGTGLCGGITSGVNPAPQMRPTGPPTSGTLTGPATVTITTDCGTVRVDAIDGNDYRLGWQGADSALAPAVEASDMSLNLRRNPASGPASPAIDWSVSLPRVPQINLDLQLNAGSATASLSGARIASLRATVNAGEAKLDLSGAGDTTGLDGTANAGSLSISLPSVPGTLAGSLHVNAGTIRVCVPATAGLRIRVDGETLASDNFAQRGMTRSNDVWTLPSWNTSSSRIDLTVTANLGTIMLNPEEGCG